MNYKYLYLTAVVLLLSACGSILDGSTSDGTSLENAAGSDSNNGGGGGNSGTTKLKMFVSSTTTAGSFGGASGADAICMSDLSKPGSGTYKALLRSSTRSPPSTDWPLKASTTYYRSDGITVIGTTTTGGIFNFPVTNSASGAADNYWTGMDLDWSAAAGLDCLDWSNGTFTEFGYLGRGTAANFRFIRNAGFNCDQPASLLCVEQ